MHFPAHVNAGVAILIIVQDDSLVEMQMLCIPVQTNPLCMDSRHDTATHNPTKITLSATAPVKNCVGTAPNNVIIPWEIVGCSGPEGGQA